MKKIVLLSLAALTFSSSAMAVGWTCGFCAYQNQKKRAANPSRDYCDYSNAANNNGWGWNAVKGTPCAPQSSQGYCDYSGAESNGGWGWNPVTKTSCR
jgi:hypothetical protein